MVGAEIYTTVGNDEKVQYLMNTFGLSGELLHATWKCVANFGKLVEIGKRDLIGSGKLDMQPFLGNRSYCCVDLNQISQAKPSLCKEYVPPPAKTLILPKS
jgi:hypothetical protein